MARGPLRVSAVGCADIKRYAGHAKQALSITLPRANKRKPPGDGGLAYGKPSDRHAQWPQAQIGRNEPGFPHACQSLYCGIT